MQTTRFLRAFALASCVTMLGHVEAQVTQDNNNPPGGSYVGHSGLNGNAVEVRHNGNFPIEWYTDSIQRMQLYPLGTPTINGFSLIDQSGFVGISARPNFFNTVGPFSRLHLVDDAGANTPITYAQQLGFRPWQMNGITFTGNSDQSYIGQKFNAEENDATDLILQWSDNTENSPWRTDRLRFLFTTNFGGAPYGARSEEGLESFRVYVPNDTSAFVGIGDWHKHLYLPDRPLIRMSAWMCLIVPCGSVSW